MISASDLWEIGASEQPLGMCGSHGIYGDFLGKSMVISWDFHGISWDENPMEYDGHTEIYPLNPSGHFKDGEWKSLTCRKNHRTLG